MSTKIFNAFYINGNNFKDIEAVILKFRELEEKNKINKFFENIVVTYFSLKNDEPLRDFLKSSLKETDLVAMDKLFYKDEYTLFNMFLNLTDHFISHESPFYNDFSISNKLFYKPIEDKTLFILSGPCVRNIYDEILSDNIQEYCYWNNTDRPNYVSAKEWNKRKNDWGFFNYKLSDDMSCVFSNTSLQVLLSTKKINKIQILLDNIKSNLSKIESTFLDYEFNKSEMKEQIQASLNQGSFSEFTKFERLCKTEMAKRDIFEDLSFSSLALLENRTEFDIINDILYKKIKYQEKLLG